MTDSNGPIPEDIAEIARKLAAIQCGSDDQCHPGICKCRDEIARAILSAKREQREADAKIADAMPWQIAISPAHVRGLKGTDVASAIRNQETGQ